MAMKRCPDCGEKYSDTYKYCPFCEEEEVLRKGKDRGGRRARQSRHFSVLTPILVVLILIMALAFVANYFFAVNVIYIILIVIVIGLVRTLIRERRKGARG